MQNFVVIGGVYCELEQSKFWSNSIEISLVGRVPGPVFNDVQQPFVTMSGKSPSFVTLRYALVSEWCALALLNMITKFPMKNASFCQIYYQNLADLCVPYVWLLRDTKSFLKTLSVTKMVYVTGDESLPKRRTMAECFAWSSIAQSVCQQAFSLLKIGFQRPSGFESCIQQRKTSCLLSIKKSLACARASKLTTTNMYVCMYVCMHVCMHACMHLYLWYIGYVSESGQHWIR